jgi:hypothetical protein
MQKNHEALEAAKIRRGKAVAAVAEAEIHAAADAADLLTCQAHVSTLDKKRANGIAANKPNAVISIDGELLRARVAVEIAAVRGTGSTAKHAALTVAMAAARIEVERCARAVIDSEMLDLAAAFNAAFDAALKIGAQLQAFALRNFLNTPLNAAVPSVPVEVTQALSRLPPPDLLNTPINVLRNGSGSDAWARRLADLIAGDEPIDVAA